MQNDKTLMREGILGLPVSLRSYLILRDLITDCGDVNIFKKLIGQYLTELPVFELQRILSIGTRMLDTDSYQEVIAMMFDLAEQEE